MNDRVTFTSRSLGRMTCALSIVIRISFAPLLAFIDVLLSFHSPAGTSRCRRRALHLLEKSVETCEVRLPDRPVLLEPRARLSERLPFETAWPPLSVLPNTDQSRPLEHLQVLGDRRLADGEGVRKLRDRGLSERKTREDRAARRICERQERVVKAL